MVRSINSTCFTIDLKLIKSISLQLDSPDGCTEFVLSGAVLGLAQWKVAPNNIVLIANFTETGTGIVETMISRTVVVHQALKLEFLPYTPKYFKLGLPYHGKVKLANRMRFCEVESNRIEANLSK